LGFVSGAPLPISPQPSSPGTQAHPRTASANCQSRSAPVVSHHLDGLLQLRLCGSIAPRNQLEVRRFSDVPAFSPPKRKLRTTRTPSQATCFTPFRAFPLPAAVPRHHLHQKPKSLLPMFTNGRCLHDVPTSGCSSHLLAPKRSLASSAVDRARTRQTPRDSSPTPLPGLVCRLVLSEKAVFKALLH